MRSKKVEPGVGGTKDSLDLNQSFDEIDSEDERERETMLQELLHEIKDEDDRELVEEMKAIGLDQWERPWISVSASSLTESEMSSDFKVGDERRVSLGFEDDFSAFVTAPETKVDSRGFLDADRDGGLYRTLGSVSDFGESEEASKKEIRDTARKIFGQDEVFGALQEYKAEIASMENEAEKRRSAAKVALGLVYGL